MIRYGTSWRSGRGRRSWVSLPLWVIVAFVLLAWPGILCWYLFVLVVVTVRGGCRLMARLAT